MPPGRFPTACLGAQEPGSMALLLGVHAGESVHVEFWLGSEY